ncbi:MAG: response regulator [Chitinophagaceae bacterium]|nr:response regulator [Anaerolineae bacterium]
MMHKTSNMKDWVVLIVDDIQDNLEVAAKILSFNGAKVYTAQNGEEGLKLLNQASPTLILLDLSMPVMNGWEMLEIVRQNPATAQIPVIAVTAHAMQGDLERIMTAGFTGYIAKPFGIATLLIEIQRALNSPVETS